MVVGRSSRVAPELPGGIRVVGDVGDEVSETASILVVQEDWRVLEVGPELELVDGLAGVALRRRRRRVRRLARERHAGPDLLGGTRDLTGECLRVRRLDLGRTLVVRDRERLVASRARHDDREVASDDLLHAGDGLETKSNVAGNSSGPSMTPSNGVSSKVWLWRASLCADVDEQDATLQ